MPQNTQMHMQWITVNGQSVPLVLPQYWDGEKWVISSEQNPLPVKAELTGSYVEEQTVTSQRSGILQGGGTTEVIFDTVGKVCELQSLSLGTNDAVYAQIRIMFYTEDGLINGYLRIARDDGSSLVNPTPFAVQEYSGGENDFWTVRKYDEQNSKYVLTMKRPLKSLNGFRIAIYNFKDEPIDVSINAVVSSQRKMVN